MQLSFKKRIIQITVASLISLILYIATYWITVPMMKIPSVAIIALALYILAFNALFSLVLIWVIYIRNGTGADIVSECFKDGYPGIMKDFKTNLKVEIKTLYAIALINSLCWAIISLDKLAFGKRTFSSILLLYAPLNISDVILPSWLNGILSYTLGSVFVYLIYLLELVIYRKKQLKKIQKMQEEYH